MIDETSKKEMLESISKYGHVNVTPLKVNTNIDHVLSFSSGAARLQTSLVRKAILIVTQPQELQELNSFQIRCCLCHKVITYPAWYYQIRYAVNHFHYFVCFDPASAAKPTARCYKRGE